jgi:hypothetical protein
LLGYTPDITVLLQFYFFEPVYYQQLDGKFPDDPKECLGRFVGIAETVGSAITFKILTESNKIIIRSVVRSATKPGIYQNHRANAEAPNMAPPEPNAILEIDDVGTPVFVKPDILDKETPKDQESPMIETMD